MISYDAMRSNTISCNRTLGNMVNYRPTKQANNAYNRGCSPLTRCPNKSVTKSEYPLRVSEI
ncbi:hypothetical protein T459_13911 [Capsicum annuum]|uniref:Uncharacterized protein n=1 Tax=Capsicum annuum TaxID=4072 RepID=A0A2G2ZFX3_CAPAN|nr:hypothetical protein T459_13911 [Capsicum annuum]